MLAAFSDQLPLGMQVTVRCCCPSIKCPSSHVIVALAPDCLLLLLARSTNPCVTFSVGQTTAGGQNKTVGVPIVYMARAKQAIGRYDQG